MNRDRTVPSRPRCGSRAGGGDIVAASRNAVWDGLSTWPGADAQLLPDADSKRVCASTPCFIACHLLPAYPPASLSILLKPPPVIPPTPFHRRPLLHPPLHPPKHSVVRPHASSPATSSPPDTAATPPPPPHSRTQADNERLVALLAEAKEWRAMAADLAAADGLHYIPVAVSVGRDGKAATCTAWSDSPTVE
eukprot:360125-Chlamydomonas_euryale.AAC.2